MPGPGHCLADQALLRRMVQRKMPHSNDRRVSEGLKDTNSIFNDLTKRSRAIRAQLGLSQTDVAKALHVTRGFISNVENGRVNMSMRLMIYYARLLNVSLDEIVGLTDEEYLSTSLDHAIMEEVSKLSLQQKQNLLDSLRGPQNAIR